MPAAPAWMGALVAGLATIVVHVGLVKSTNSNSNDFRVLTTIGELSARIASLERQASDSQLYVNDLRAALNITEAKYSAAINAAENRKEHAGDGASTIASLQARMHAAEEIIARLLEEEIKVRYSASASPSGGFTEQDISFRDDSGASRRLSSSTGSYPTGDVTLVLPDDGVIYFGEGSSAVGLWGDGSRGLRTNANLTVGGRWKILLPLVA